MGKLNNNQINKQIKLETALSTGTHPRVPIDALSMFRFQIEESIEEVLSNCLDTENWDLAPKAYNGIMSKEELQVLLSKGEGSFALKDQCQWSYATIKFDKDSIKIVTAWSGFEYYIKRNMSGGCEVLFDGSINGILSQHLLPKMTIVDGTMEGAFASPDYSRQITDWMSGFDFWLMREEKNLGRGSARISYHLQKHFN